ncbi:sodium/glucose cotransporter 4-like [Watersipora subatra]|uniref:sodium/glucose cotransporter 4-like n=1 Tax=Watersipora subatra TaxID=2589382 RepID=UPI00355BE78E
MSSSGVQFEQKLMWGDAVVIAVYFIIVIGVGLWSSCRNRGSTQGYFLAGRSMHWLPVGASLFASNIGSGHFVGLAGSGSSTGIGVAIYELSATYVLLLLGWVFVPVYIASGVFTMPEYMRQRFGGRRIRAYLAVLSLLIYIFTKITADLYSGVLLLQQAIGLTIYPSAAVLLALAMLFTIAGGLTAVIWTDFAQTGIMLIGATVLTAISLVEVAKKEPNLGSTYEALTQQFFTAYAKGSLTSNGSCGSIPDYALKFMRPATLLDDDLPWTGVLFGITISGIWYWCSDQVIVQRSLAAKNLSHAKAGTVFAGLLKFAPLWLLVIPGMASRILYPDGVKGLMIAVMLSALMSSLTSIFNSSSTLFTMDIWRVIRKQSGEGELLVVGRIFVVILVGVSLAWLPIVGGFPELFHYIQQITSFLTPPITAVYILAVSWKRINEEGAFWGLMTGFVVGLIRFLLQYAVYPQPPPCGSDEENKVPDIVHKVHYLHFGCILFVITFIVTIVVSLLTKPINPRKLIRLTFMSRDEPGERLDQAAEDDVPEHLEYFQSTNSMAASTDKLTNGDVKEEATGADDALPWYRVAVNWICGIEKQSAAPTISDEEKNELMKKNLSIDESKTWRLINNFAAGFVLVGTTFLWGYFA